MGHEVEGRRNRSPGYYWVQTEPNFPNWQIGEWDGCYCTITGDECTYSDLDFLKIGSIVEKPNGL